MPLRQRVRTLPVRRNPKKPDLQAAFANVPAPVAEAAIAASEALRAAGIRHVLVGGLAVGAHGYHRTTRDVDFLLGDEGFVHHRFLVTHRPEVPLRHRDVAIDSLEDPELSALFAQVPAAGEIPVIPVEALVLMKLVAWRPKDRHDVAELYQVGAFTRSDVVAFLTTMGREDLIPHLDHILAEVE